MKEQSERHVVLSGLFPASHRGVALYAAKCAGVEFETVFTEGQSFDEENPLDLVSKGYIYGEVLGKHAGKMKFITRYRRRARDKDARLQSAITKRQERAAVGVKNNAPMVSVVDFTARSKAEELAG
jgi:hypothetical protein